MRATCPFHPPWFNHPNNIWKRPQTMGLLSTRFSLACCYLSPEMKTEFYFYILSVIVFSLFNNAFPAAQSPSTRWYGDYEWWITCVCVCVCCISRKWRKIQISPHSQSTLSVGRSSKQGISEYLEGMLTTHSPCSAVTRLYECKSPRNASVAIIIITQRFMRPIKVNSNATATVV
jgi:hypothetical protein